MRLKIKQVFFLLGMISFVLGKTHYNYKPSYQTNIEINEVFSFDCETNFFIPLDNPRIDFSKVVIKKIPTKSFNFPLGENLNSKFCLRFSTAFTKNGMNFFDIIPQKKIVLKGNIQNLSFWLWGGNQKYTIYLHLITEDKKEIIVKLARLTYLGWKKIFVALDLPLKESGVKLDFQTTLIIKKIRVWSDLDANHNECQFFIDSFKYKTKTRVLIPHKKN